MTDKKGISPFDILKDITFEKVGILEPWDMSSYSPFMVNKGLMQHQDTIHFAAEMNKMSHVPKDLQYDFYMAMVPKRKRFGKWVKAEADDQVEAIMEVYGVRRSVALSYLKSLKPEHLEDVNRRRNTGQRVKQNNANKRGTQSP